MEQDAFLPHTEYQAQTQARGRGYSPSARASLQLQQQQQQFYPAMGGAYAPTGQLTQGPPLVPGEQQSYLQSPTLSASQSLLARTQAGPGVSGVIGGVSGYIPGSGGEDRLDYVVDPYRSAYAQQHGASSPYHGSAVPPDDLNQGSYNPRYSFASSNGAAVGGGGQRYPMHTLQSQGSNQALLSSAFRPQASTATTAPSSESEFGGGKGSEPDHDISEESGGRGIMHSGRSRQSSAAMHQFSSTESGMSRRMHKGDEEEAEEDENAEILQRVSQSHLRNGGAVTENNGGKNNRRSNSTRRIKGLASFDDSEEEGQERGATRRKDSKRCWCCSRRVCVYISFFLAICLGVALFFVVPRAPSFSYYSVKALGPPVVTKDQIEEPFTLQIRADNNDNYLPFRLTSMEMTVWLKLGMTKIGNNDDFASSFVIKPRQISVISVPMTLSYTSLMIDTNADGTLQELISACRPVDPNANGPVQGINLTFGGKMHVWGLSWIWKPQFSFNVDGVPCPVNARDPVELPPPAHLPSTPSTPPGNGTATATHAGSATHTATGTSISTQARTSSAPATSTP
ncbi:hypothetical protein BGX28_003354 [Mortierella sp. GBA30]|nr:hypothetical protein BGX28_003354 [Mortierella sp. GBA30]